MEGVPATADTLNDILSRGTEGNDDILQVVPKPIRPLKESLINRIAAGEVIQRPASALKELIENCLDAGATNIRVTVKDGGLKLLQIQDNGCGINKSDLPILAQRFTTSKLAEFSDLSKLVTYGFRGEALASISHVAKLTVTTKTKADSHAWKAVYSEGILAPPKPGLSVDPKPCAGNDGTTITIEELFANMPSRLSALRSSSDEYSRILDVVTKYAVHRSSVSFSCKKQGTSSTDISTPSGSSTLNTIRLLYGQSVSKDLLHIQLSSSKSVKSPPALQAAGNNDEDDGEEQSWSAEVYCTNANYQSKKTQFLLFINHRLVDSTRIKRALEGVYAPILPKGASSFIYLSLEIDPATIDVNVHPTKREVFFINEEPITARIADAIQAKLVAQSQTKTFQYQTLLTGGIADPSANTQKGKEKSKAVASEPEDGEGDDDDEGDEDEPSGGNTPATGAANSSAPTKKKVLSQHKVRTSLHDRTLDSMFAVESPTQAALSKHASSSSSSVAGAGIGKLTSSNKEIKESKCYLTSVIKLREGVVENKHSNLTEIMTKHTFCGVVDLDRCLSLVQHSTKLYLVNHDALAEELFYQLGLRQFGNFSRLKLDPPPSLRMLVTIAVENEDINDGTALSKQEIIDRILDLLVSRSAMLSEYFSFNISSNGDVESLPLLLPGYTPNLDKLPMFLMRLGPQVDWTSESECFDTFLRELAYFYVPGPLLPPGPVLVTPATAEGEDKEGDKEKKAKEQAERWQIEHVLFPAMRRYLMAPKSLLNGDVVQVANLPDLYRVFERC